MVLGKMLYFSFPLSWILLPGVGLAGETREAKALLPEGLCHPELRGLYL
jgi:hypothetical protein